MPRKKKAKSKDPKRQIAALKGVITRLKNEQIEIPVNQSIPNVKEVIVRYGGVVRTGAYENRRVSYEMSSDCPAGADPAVVCQYLESIVANQFYQAQIKALDGLPADVRDDIQDFSHLSPQEACQRIGEFFVGYSKSRRMDPEEKTAKIKSLQKELKELAPNIRKCNDVEVRKDLVSRQNKIKKELTQLRKE